MRRFRSVLFLLIISLPLSVLGQTLTGTAAQEIIDGASEIKLSETYNSPEYIQFRKGEEIPVADFQAWAVKALDINEDYSFQEINRFKDQLDFTHIRYSLNYQGFPLANSMVILHTKNGKIKSLNGVLPPYINITNSFILSKKEALNYALDFADAETYKWEIPEEELFIKKFTENPDATFYPEGEKTIIQTRTQGEPSHAYAYKFDIYAHKPVYRADVYVDASTGEVLLEDKTIQHADSLGSANTKYSGTRNITADYYNGSFRLRESGRGNGIETYDMNNSTTYFSAVDFTDTDNYWNNYNSNMDEVATDAHWAAEKTYDYYYNNHNRNSIDNNGMTITSYIHYDVDYVNAFWNGQYMTYGDGNGSSITPLTAIDIVAHEITHGVTSFTADLIYQDESGALNEGFSDIFGATVEAYARPNNFNWDIGEDIGAILRSMANPNAYQLPDTYHGNYWYFGSQDNGGVHTNMGVFSYWYYLLVEGGSGVNDNNDSYSVTAIGMDSAAAIAYRMLNVYLTPSSQYTDARFYAIKAATDLYGPCSQAVASVTNAMYATGVGNAYVPGVQADFNADITSFCQPPATVNFQNLSNNGINFTWDFGDGNTSTTLNPSHTYTQYGDYTVQLIADGGTCGSDTIIDTAYISIDSNNPCQTITPQSGNITVTNCNGFLYDDGGPSGNYSDNSNSSVTIAPPGASSIDITFSDFHFESGYDYLNIYEGTSTSGTLIGSYDGSSLPNGGNISSTTGAVTIEQETDAYVNESGFALEWSCTYPNAAPTVDFAVNDTFSCEGLVQFNDLSNNGPTSWTWHFGDGTTSNMQNPVHQYNQSGVYDIKLKATNSFGTDSLEIQSYLHVKLPDSINGETLHYCNPGSVSLQTSGNGTVYWYEDNSLSNLIDTGNVLNISTLSSDRTVYAVDKIIKPAVYGAKQDNSGGGGYYTSPYEHYLMFDTYQDITLISVKVYAGSAGNRQITLRNSNGVVIESKTLNIPQGEHRINLDFDIPAGSNYELVGPTSPDLYRNNNGLSYPYDVSGLATVHQSSASSDPFGYYYYFYDWKIQPEPCSGPKAIFDLIVYNNSPVADFDHQVNQSQVSFTNQSSKSASYHWDFDDGNTSSANNPVHYYTQTGTYDVQLIANNPCGSDTIEKSVTITQTGINENTDNKIKVYPNPADNLITIDFSKYSDAYPESVMLFSIEGKLILHTTKVSGKKKQLSIPVQHLNAGVYFIKINMGDQLINKKVIVN